MWDHSKFARYCGGIWWWNYLSGSSMLYDMGFKAYQLWHLGPLHGLAPNSMYFKYLILQNIATAMIANVMCTNPSTCNQSKCDEDSR